jgi:predicted nuclease of predicted toxin-antitoxin system
MIRVMIYLLCDNRKLAYLKATEMSNALIKKQPNVNLVKINAENYSDEILEEFINAQGLFVVKNIILLSGVFSDIKSDFVFLNLEKIQESENIFIFIEGEINQRVLEQIESAGGKVQKFKNSNLNKRNQKDNKIFEIADSFGRRDKKNLWIKYQELLLHSGASEILNIVWWQIKAIKSAMISNNASDAGLSPFVYTKSKSFSRNFSPKEIDNLIVEILNIQNESYHDDNIIKEKLEILFLKKI